MNLFYFTVAYLQCHTLPFTMRECSETFRFLIYTTDKQIKKTNKFAFIFDQKICQLVTNHRLVTNHIMVDISGTVLNSLDFFFFRALVRKILVCALSAISLCTTLHKFIKNIEFMIIFRNLHSTYTIYNAD
jgi:hypothetical protein